MPVVYGRNPVREGLRIDPSGIEKIVVAEGGRGENLRSILALAVAKGVTVEFRERAYLDRLAAGGSHQGVAALVKNIPGLTLEEMIDRRHPELSGDLVLIADGVMDPRNLGALIRTAHCFGVNGVVVPRHRAAGITAAVVKASAGAAYLTPVVTVENLARTVDFLKEQGFWTYGAAAEAAVFLDNLTFEGRVAIVVGGEGGGIRSLVRKKLDFLFAIPMIGNINSLNVSVAAGIVLHTAYQAMRKRG